MKISRLSLLALIPALTLFFATPSSAQAPNGQFGIQAGTYGFGLQYAISPSLQLGTMLALTQGDFQTDATVLTPYVKFLLEGDPVNPFITAGIEYSDVEGGGDADITVLAGFGLDYYASENIGVFGHFDVFALGEDALGESALGFGIFNGKVGVEWFFD